MIGIKDDQDLSLAWQKHEVAHPILELLHMSIEKSLALVGLRAR
jgi:hypothetical protein